CAPCRVHPRTRCTACAAEPLHARATGPPTPARPPPRASPERAPPRASCALRRGQPFGLRPRRLEQWCSALVEQRLGHAPAERLGLRRRTAPLGADYLDATATVGPTEKRAEPDPVALQDGVRSYRDGTPAREPREDRPLGADALRGLRIVEGDGRREPGRSADGLDRERTLPRRGKGELDSEDLGHLRFQTEAPEAGERGKRAEREPFRKRERNVFRAVHRQIGPALRERLLQLLDEEALAADFRQRSVEDAVSLGGHRHELASVSALAQPSLDALGLPE